MFVPTYFNVQLRDSQTSATPELPGWLVETVLSPQTQKVNKPMSLQF